MLGSSLFAQAIPLLSLPILTRLFPAESFGVLALLLSVAAALAVLSTLRFDLAMVLPDLEEEAVDIAGLTCLTTIVVALLTIIIGVGGLEVLQPSSVGISSAVGLSLVVAMTILIAVQQVSIAFATRRKNFPGIAATGVISHSTNLFVAVVSGLFSPTLTALAEARAFGQLAASGNLVRQERTAWSQISLQRSALRARELLKRYRPFILFNAPYSLVGSLMRDIPLYTLLTLHSASTAGLYGIARTVTFAPALLGSAAFSQVFFRYALENRASLEFSAQIKRWLRLGLVASAPAFAIAAAWGEEIFSLVFGQAWAESGSMAASLAIAAWWSLQTSWPERIFEVQGKQVVSFTIQSVGDLITAFGFILLVWSDARLTTSIALLALGQSLTYQIYTAYVARLSGLNRSAVVALAIQGWACFGFFYVVYKVAGEALESSEWAMALSCVVAVAGAVLLLKLETRFASRRS